MYTTLDQARKALEAAEADVVADFGEEALDAGFYDVVHNIAQDCSKSVARELLRTELGLGIFPTDPDPLEAVIYPVVVDPEFKARVAARVAEFRNRAYWSR